MKVRIINSWEEIRSSYWFVPAVMILGAFVLALITIALDGAYEFQILSSLGLLWGGGGDGARELVSTVAGSLITVASLTFSITIVAISQASSQFGPRLLRNFMRDTSNQVVLGTFVATFVYCLMILRTIRVDGNEFVPRISVSLALIFTIFSIGVLIYFIHHAVRSIYAPNVIATVAGELMHTIDRLLPDDPKDEPQRRQHKSPGEVLQPDGLELKPLPAPANGYIQAVDYGRLLEIADENETIIRLNHRPGHFVVAGNRLVELFGQEQIEEHVEGAILQQIVIGKERTQTQDIEFAVDQLVDVAVRALSPGINDPTTAINCIDWLGAALVHLAQKPLPLPYWYNPNGELRLVIEHAVTYSGVVDAAFNQIRQAAVGNVAVTVRLLEAINTVRQRTDISEFQEALERHAQMIEHANRREKIEPDDREDIERRIEDLEQV